MKKLAYKILAVSAILVSFAGAQAATVTVTNIDDGVSNVGAVGTFYWAITNCQPGDTIAFNIDTNIHGTGPYYFKEPTNGFPIIYQKHGITIDGYTQPGSMWNTNPITGSNSAKIKIVIDGRNNQARSLDISHFDGTLAKSDPPINNTAMASDPHPSDNTEWALLAIYRSTNVTVKGLAFLSDNLYNYIVAGVALVDGIAILHDYGLDTSIHDALTYPAGDSRNAHICGCWFGVDPGNPTKGSVTITFNWIQFGRWRGDDGPIPAGNGTQRPQLPNVGLTIGVAPGAANPRSEFNVIVGGAYNFAGEPVRQRISGNFVGMMPDGVTPFDMSSENPTTAYVFGAIGYVTVEMGRYDEIFADSATAGRAVVIGTDGDGVNDADEGNLWGPVGGAPGLADPSQHAPALIHYYETGNKDFLIAGNRWGIGNDGTIWPNSAFFMSGMYVSDTGVNGQGNSRLWFGSDFATNRSAATIAAQANYFYNNLPITLFGNPVAVPLTGCIPFLDYEHPNSSEIASANSCVSLRGNVMAGNGLAPYNYADNTGSLLTQFTNFWTVYLNINTNVIPVLDTNSVFPHLAGTFAAGVAPFTNVFVDVYQLDPYGWTNGQKFALAELVVGSTTNGFPQGKKFLGSFPVANTGSFNITLPPSTDLGNGQLTVTANYSTAPAGTPCVTAALLPQARTMTSQFANPITMIPPPFITVTNSGGNLNISWDVATSGPFTVQTNSSVVSPGTWGNFTSGNVSPPVSVPIGSGSLFIRLKKL